MKSTDSLIAPMKKLSKIIVILISASMANQDAAADSLSLDTYLGEVETSHSGVRAAIESSHGAKLRAQEAELLYSPTATATVQYYDDQRIPTSAFSPRSTRQSSVSLGLSKLTSFGLQSKLSYSVSHTQLEAQSPGSISLPDYYDASPTLEFSMSLWRNGLGRETQATERLLRSGAIASYYGENFKAKLLRLEAEITYYRLALAREVVTIQRDSLKRAQALKDWSQKRARLQLADRSDMLQAEAAVQIRELELTSAGDEEKRSSRAFNSLRGNDTEAVTDRVARPSPESILKLDAKVRTGVREDLLAAEQVQVATAASAQVSREKNKPSLDLYATVGLSGRDASTSEAFSKSADINQRAATVGIKLSAPLYFETQSEVRAGYAQDAHAATLLYERKRFEQEQDWKNGAIALDEAKTRMKLTANLVELQSQKLSHEKDRHRRGRSTTYQVLLFEQDYSSAQLSHAQAQTEVLRSLAQLKTFTGDKQP